MKRVYLALVFFGLLVVAGCSPKQEVVGLWVYSVAGGLGEARLELNDDHTGYMRIMSLTETAESDIHWKVENQQLCTSIKLSSDDEYLPDDGFWNCNEYAIEEDRMTYSLMGGEPVLFERWPDN